MSIRIGGWPVPETEGADPELIDEAADRLAAAAYALGGAGAGFAIALPGWMGAEDLTIIQSAYSTETRPEEACATILCATPSRDLTLTSLRPESAPTPCVS